MVPNGPDDCEKEPCECQTEGKFDMAKVLAEYPSKSSPGKKYTIIEAADGTPYCDCWQWKRNKTCAHLKDWVDNNGDGTTVLPPSPPIPVGTEEEAGVDHVIHNIINKFDL